MIELNYLIALEALIASILLFRKSQDYRMSAYHMLFIFFAALLGGFHHHLNLRWYDIMEFVNRMNLLLPTFMDPFNLEHFSVRLWFLTYVSIGLTEYSFMAIFLYPVIEKTGWMSIKLYLKSMLAIFIVISLFTGEYLGVVSFHVVSHVIMIVFSVFIIVKYQIRSGYYLLIGCIFNLVIGVLQQVMANGIIPSGPLHHNDWYHILIIGFVLFLYYIITKGGLIEDLCSFAKPNSYDKNEINNAM